MRQYEDLLIDALLDRGFTLPEAQNLICLQERVERERAKRERETQTGSPRAGFNGPEPRDTCN
jgi:hypothetical protein